MIASLLVKFYCLVHGKLHLPGAGWLIRRMLPIVPQLRNYPFKIPGVGTAMLDFRDTAALGMLNYSLDDFGDDKQLLKWLRRLLRPGDVLWDVGANLGYLTMYFAKTSPDLASIHAFEPNPAPLKTLQPLFSGSRLVRVHPVGLGSRDETMQLRTLGTDTGWGTVARSLEGQPGTEVRIRKGDSYRREQGIPSPNVMKIDVEGFEPEVMSGLQSTISEVRPCIVLEHIWLSDEQLRKLTPPDYSLRFIMEDGTLSTDFSNRMQGINAILVHSADTRKEVLG
ncbi:MAG TPA: FkbM family methyltransferase [Candidatus Binatia bacterium]|nr:FkbM family methyltransferase [Candidatus Binatia bacterium]